MEAGAGGLEDIFVDKFLALHEVGEHIVVVPAVVAGGFGPERVVMGVASDVDGVADAAAATEQFAGSCWNPLLLQVLGSVVVVCGEVLVVE